ncbi:MAG: cytochrome bc complex cytochrome b subunit [Haloarculaceae archaeon]
MPDSETHEANDELPTHDPYPNSRLFRWLDDRLGLNHALMGKAFPEDKYGSFLLGEVALFTFVLLALSGTFLGLLYTPAAESTTYTGNALDYAGKQVPAAFASVLHITYDVPFGMFIRMVHHWGAYLFVAAIGLHMFRVFFSGAYRNPHEPNWFVGGGLLLLSLVEGFFGYALPFDNFSKTATVIGYQMTGTIPVIGHEMQLLLFGGEFPANAATVIPRMFFLHVLLLPGALVGLIALHMAILMRQKHTEHAPSSREGPHNYLERDDDTFVAGVPLYPQQFLVTIVVFFITAATLSFLAGFFPVQRIALLGPADPTATPSHVGPDWFFMWVFGALKLVPSSLGSLGRFVGGVLIPTVIIGGMLVWPLIDNEEEATHFTTDPLERPMQTAVGVGAIMLIVVLSIDGMRPTIADVLGVTRASLYPWLVALTISVPTLESLAVYALLKRRQSRLEGDSTAADAQVTDAPTADAPATDDD